MLPVEIEEWSLFIQETAYPSVNNYLAPEMWVPIETVHLQGYIPSINQWGDTSPIKSVQLTDQGCTVTTISGSVYKLVRDPADEYKQFLAIELQNLLEWTPMDQWTPLVSYNLVRIMIEGARASG